MLLLSRFFFVFECAASQNSQALATTLLAFIRGQEALHEAGVKPAQLKTAAEQMIALIPRG
jgi:TetR/AcrR family transcriptional repressor of nem operon